jgi:signal transduction histidine kinase
LFLAVREALNNVVKHANASEVRMQLRVEDSHLDLSIEDDGSGLSESQRQGEGLRNMRQRLERASGQCVIESTASGGTRVAFKLPLRPTASVQR